MALPSTVFKAELQISDMDRHYYQTHSLTLARHPSETSERMMIRLLAFAMNAAPDLSFANGLTNPDEPDLWEKDPCGDILRFILVGLPDEKQIKKACSRAAQAMIYCYGGSTVDVWWAGLNTDKFSNLWVWNVPQEASLALAATVERGMKIQCSTGDGHVYWSVNERTVEIMLKNLKRPVMGR
jgi:uncharacterized protein YaeQ